MPSSTPSLTAVADISPSWTINCVPKLNDELTAKYGHSQRARIERGVHQVAEFWRD